MKTKTFKHLATIIGVCFLSLSAFSQSRNDEILGSVENPGNYTTIELAQMDRSLSTFMNLVALSDMGASWKLADEEFTIFIPTNAAFDEMEIERWNHLTNPKNQTDLIRFVKYHFVPKKIMKYDFEDDQIISTGVEEEIAISADGTFDTVYVGGAKIIKADIEASDGIIHIMNSIVEPNVDFLLID